jgi:hypothetical protein
MDKLSGQKFFCQNFRVIVIWRNSTREADVMIFKIFSPKNSAKKLAFLTQNKAKF